MNLSFLTPYFNPTFLIGTVKGFEYIRYNKFTTS